MTERSIAPAFLARAGSTQWSLVGRSCGSCGETVFGRADQACPKCGGGDLSDVELAPTGRVWGFTVLRSPSPGVRKSAGPALPYAVGLVEIDGSGLLVLTHIDVPPDTLAIGDAVTFQTRDLYTDDEGTNVVGFSFRGSADA